MDWTIILTYVFYFYNVHSVYRIIAAYCSFYDKFFVGILTVISVRICASMHVSEYDDVNRKYSIDSSVCMLVNAVEIL